MPPPKPPETRPTWDSPRAVASGALLLGVLLLAAYANSFRVPFLLDDNDAIAANPTIRSLVSAWIPPSDSGITTSGRPLLNVSFALNHRWHGTDVTCYHVTNLSIHALGALTLWALVCRTLRRGNFSERVQRHAVPLAWFTATLWALHPLQTESVTYIVQRAESLVGLFYLLTLYTFVRAVETRRTFWAIGAVAACACGMASKEVMSTAPLVVFLYNRTFVSGSFGEAWRRHRRLHLALAGTWLVLVLCLLQSGGRGSTVGFAQITAWDYAITQTTAVAGYLWRSVWPANLIFDYGAIVEKDPAAVVPACIVLAALLFATIVLLRRRPVAGFALACFFLILAPTSSIIPVATQTIAEHRVYLPLAAFIGAIVLLLHHGSPRYCWPVLGGLLLAAACRTYDRNHDYRSELAIWEDTVKRVPDNVRALNNLGSALYQSGQNEAAIDRFRAALELAPDHLEAQHNLGCAYLDLRRYPEAIASLEAVVKRAPDNPLFHASLGRAMTETQQPEKALAHYQRAHELKPDVAAHAYNLANTLMSLDRMDEAGRLYRRALELDPSDVEVMNNYATWLRRSQRPAEAVALLDEALRLQPNSARLRSNRGTALLMAGRIADGIRELENALPLDPNLAQTRYNLGSALAENDRPAEAIPHFEALLKSHPPTPELLDTLGVLYARVARYDDAVLTFREALRLNPNHRNARENLEQTEAFLRRRRPR
jgi:protein O-mannosyl-transferase